MSELDCTSCSGPAKSVGHWPIGSREWAARSERCSRHRPRTLADGVDWRAADATDPDAATDAAKGASVIYQCLNAPYTEWPKRSRRCSRACSAAAERNGALLVSLENSTATARPTASR